MVKCLPAMQETQVRSLGQEDPLKKGTATTPALLPGKSHGQRSLIGYSPWGRKESDTTEQLYLKLHVPSYTIISDSSYHSFLSLRACVIFKQLKTTSFIYYVLFDV